MSCITQLYQNTISDGVCDKINQIFAPDSYNTCINYTSSLQYNIAQLT